MDFDIINDNKLRIILHSTYLTKEHINIHSFMSNSIDSQSLWIKILNKAKKEVNFFTDNCFIKVENLIFAHGNFIITISKDVKKENENTSDVHAIYRFEAFEDFCSFLNYLKNNLNNTNIAKKIILYEFNKNYFLLLSNFKNKRDELVNTFLSIASEFAIRVNSSYLFEGMLIEKGKIIMNHNALSIGINIFAQNKKLF